MGFFEGLIDQAHMWACTSFIDQAHMGFHMWAFTSFIDHHRRLCGKCTCIGTLATDQACQGCTWFRQLVSQCVCTSSGVQQSLYACSSRTTWVLHCNIHVTLLCSELIAALLTTCQLWQVVNYV